MFGCVALHYKIISLCIRFTLQFHYIVHLSSVCNYSSIIFQSYNHFILHLHFTLLYSKLNIPLYPIYKDTCFAFENLLLVKISFALHSKCNIILHYIPNVISFCITFLLQLHFKPNIGLHYMYITVYITFKLGLVSKSLSVSFQHIG